MLARQHIGHALAFFATGGKRFPYRHGGFGFREWRYIPFPASQCLAAHNAFG